MLLKELWQQKNIFKDYFRHSWLVLMVINSFRPIFIFEPGFEPRKSSVELFKTGPGLFRAQSLFTASKNLGPGLGAQARSTSNVH